MQLAADAGHALSDALTALAEQVPTPFKLHAMHVPQEVTLQQTPSVHFPVTHSALDVHVAP
jgi:hypothetical protein